MMYSMLMLIIIFIQIVEDSQVCCTTIMYACRPEKESFRRNSVHYRTMLCRTLKKTIN